jgi:hypothetical protein
MLKFITKAKNLFFMVFFSLLTLSVLNSCSKTNKLDGTTWKGSYSFQSNDSSVYEKNFSGTADVTISFSESAVNLSKNYTQSYELDRDRDGEFETVVESGIESASGTYVYSKKSVTINLDGIIMIGIMDDKNTMKLSMRLNEIDLLVKEPVKFTKQ